MKHNKLLKSIHSGEIQFCIVIGNNGAGKTTLLNKIYSEVKNKDTGFYTINSNRQFCSANPFDSEQYKKGILSRIVSTGESLLNEIRDTFNHDTIILDEPTASLDLLNTSLVIESFIRSTANIKIISSNDYITLKLLSNYIDKAYDVSTGEYVKITNYINELIDKAIKELKLSHFKQVDYGFYKKLKE